MNTSLSLPILVPFKKIQWFLACFHKYMQSWSNHFTLITRKWCPKMYLLFVPSFNNVVEILKCRHICFKINKVGILCTVLRRFFTRWDQSCLCTIKLCLLWLEQHWHCADLWQTLAVRLSSFPQNVGGKGDRWKGGKAGNFHCWNHWQNKVFSYNHHRWLNPSWFILISDWWPFLISSDPSCPIIMISPLPFPW